MLFDIPVNLPRATLLLFNDLTSQFDLNPIAILHEPPLQPVAPRPAAFQRAMFAFEQVCLQPAPAPTNVLL